MNSDESERDSVGRSQHDDSDCDCFETSPQDESDRDSIASSQQDESDCERFAASQQDESESDSIAASQQDESDRDSISVSQQDGSERDSIAASQQDESERDTFEMSQQDESDRDSVASSQQNESERDSIGSNQQDESEQDSIAASQQDESDRDSIAASQQDGSERDSIVARQQDESERDSFEMSQQGESDHDSIALSQEDGSERDSIAASQPDESHRDCVAMSHQDGSERDSIVASQQDESERDSFDMSEQGQSDRDSVASSQQNESDRDSIAASQQDESDRNSIAGSQQDESDRDSIAMSHQDGSERDSIVVNQQNGSERDSIAASQQDESDRDSVAPSQQNESDRDSVAASQQDESDCDSIAGSQQDESDRDSIAMSHQDGSECDTVASSQQDESERDSIETSQQDESDRDNVAASQQDESDHNSVATSQQDESDRDSIVASQQDESDRDNVAASQQDESDHNSVATSQQDESDRDSIAASQQDESDRDSVAMSQQDESDRDSVAMSQQDESDRGSVAVSQQDEDSAIPDDSLMASTSDDSDEDIFHDDRNPSPSNSSSREYEELDFRFNAGNPPASSTPVQSTASERPAPTNPANLSVGSARPTVPEAQSVPGGSGDARARSPGGPPAKILKTEDRRDVADRSDNEDDGETCPICLDRWSNSADHRLVALKCGHLFGCKCIKQWLQSQRLPDRKCPTCKAKANVRDIRYLYARRLIAVDSSEVDSLKEQLEQTKSQKNRVELELQQCQIQARSTLAELMKLRSDVKGRSAAPNQRKPVSYHYSLERTLDITQEPTCRVLAYNSRKYELCASQKTSLALFPGYGVKKIDCVSLAAGQFVHLHPKAIRDLQYSSTNDLFLSVSQDKTAKLMCGQNSQVTSTIKTDHPLWSCCWSILNPNELLIGGDGGVTLQYDIRSANAPVGRYAATGADVTPVVSLASTPDGFLACHLNSCWFYNRVGSEHLPYMLPIDGAFLSLSYEDVSKQMLVSCRPTTAYQRARHIVANVDVKNGDINCNIVHTFIGSSVQHLMSRSRQMRIGEESWVAAHNESAAAVCLYSVNAFKLMQSLVTHDRIVDICPVERHDGVSFLATLSTTKVRIYKAAVV